MKTTERGDNILYDYDNDNCYVDVRAIVHCGDVGRYFVPNTFWT
jgi:hypothetical protein